MKKSQLIEKIRSIDKNYIYLEDIEKVFSSSQDLKIESFIKVLQIKIEEVFKINELSSKKRDTNFVVARSVFFFLGHRHGISKMGLSKFMNRTHATVLNSLKEFETYKNQYKEFNAEILLCLQWYKNNFNSKS